MVKEKRGHRKNSIVLTSVQLWGRHIWRISQRKTNNAPAVQARSDLLCQEHASKTSLVQTSTKYNQLLTALPLLLLLLISAAYALQCMHCIALEMSFPFGFPRSKCKKVLEGFSDCDWYMILLMILLLGYSHTDDTVFQLCSILKGLGV